jgi:hypothetical protein
MSKILVTFNCQIGEYESNSYYIFDKKNLIGVIANIFGV